MFAPITNAMVIERGNLPATVVIVEEDGTNAVANVAKIKATGVAANGEICAAQQHRK